MRTQTVESPNPQAFDDELDHWWTRRDPDVPVCEYDAERIAWLMSRAVINSDPPPPGACVVCLDYYRRLLRACGRS
jgi:hypothetical protein